MLVLKRKAGESIIVADNIEIKIIEVEEGRIKIGIDAPKEVSIIRKEVLDETKSENKTAAESRNIDKSALTKMLKNKK
ncbi:carbon storage regulator [Acetoanaerobium sticklandii]|uniref:Translational regulator CsrA n=1 Tax=Acetoanaerobium sticklandii (strain ATCC 12662 / DSM 519 / JCM 1433 / CCUG 9281 / NCIMB 10654 / HF) TaxID=499177 RepID=E3PUM5_ACESD|nr:carbon storage regulator CsrA [Acetoanaerobium sticklandii]CBH22463.1 carbon storage regulator [Acetoanaerobium sticklandii]